MKSIVVSNRSQTPIYQQLYDQISSQIINGDLKADDALPSLRTLAKEIRVSIITIKKTWELLEHNGFIYTVKGKGSYVSKNSASSLNKKKLETIKNTIHESIKLSKDYNITKEELIAIVNDLYDE